MFFLVSPFNIIFNYITSFIVVYFILKINILKTILASILPSFVFTIVQSLLFNPYITLLNISYDEALTIPMYKIPITLVMYAVIFILSFILKRKHFSLKILDDIDSVLWYLINNLYS